MSEPWIVALAAMVVLIAYLTIAGNRKLDRLKAQHEDDITRSRRKGGRK